MLTVHNFSNCLSPLTPVHSLYTSEAIGLPQEPLMTVVYMFNSDPRSQVYSPVLCNQCFQGFLKLCCCCSPPFSQCSSSSLSRPAGWPGQQPAQRTHPITGTSESQWISAEGMNGVRFTWMPPTLMLWVLRLKDRLVFSHSDSSQIFCHSLVILISACEFIFIICASCDCTKTQMLTHKLNSTSDNCFVGSEREIYLFLHCLDSHSLCQPVREWAHVLSVLWSAKCVHRAPKCYWPSISCKNCQHDWVKMSSSIWSHSCSMMRRFCYLRSSFLVSFLNMLQNNK